MAPGDGSRPKSSAKDIASLFAKAGVTGSAYREFAKNGAQGNGKAGKQGTSKGAVVARAANGTSQGPGSAAAAESQSVMPSWSSLERVFSGLRPETAAGEGGRPGLKIGFLSLAGGVGKTTLSTSLARLLSARHRQVLLADCGLYPAVLHHLGPRTQRLGPVHFFYPPSGVSGLPVGILRISLLDLRSLDFADMIRQVETEESFVLLDLPTLQSPLQGEMLAYFDHILVPVNPTLHSISSLSTLRQLMERAAGEDGGPNVHYVLNAFDASRVLHNEIRKRLEQMLEGALLPTAVRYEPAFEEAMAQGMTVIDYLPESTVLDELTELAGWVDGLLAHHVSQRIELTV